MKYHIKRQDGFTILELLIATTIFSFIMLIATTGIVRLGQLYYKGITQSKTQETARNIQESLTRTMQFGKGDIADTSASGITSKCVGRFKYTYFFNEKVEDPNSTGISTPDQKKGLYVEESDPDNPCSSALFGGTKKQLLGKNMRLLKFDVSDIPGTDNLVNISIKIAYGENGLLDHYSNETTRIGGDVEREKANCKSGVSGSSFCATAELDTIVKKRL